MKVIRPSLPIRTRAALAIVLGTMLLGGCFHEPPPEEVEPSPITYPYTGIPQSISVPNGAVAALVVAQGGSGGYGSIRNANPGLAANVTALVEVETGQFLQIAVGQVGSPNGTIGGGWGNAAPGGAGVAASSTGVGSSGGGGGATTVELNGVVEIIAAGGGGAGGSVGTDVGPPGGAGGSGGRAPGNGAQAGCSGERGSGTAPGGLGGSAPGQPGLDGSRSTFSPGGGGGGGGYRGGGGGGQYNQLCFSSGGGGGAGSSFANEELPWAAIATATFEGNGFVQVTWLTDMVTLSLSADSTTVEAGDTATFHASLMSGSFIVADVTQNVFWSSSDSSDIFSAPGIIEVTNAGPHTITATLDSFVANATIQVLPGPPATPISLSSPAGVQVFDTVPFVLASFDQYGNIAQNLTNQATYSTDNPADTVDRNVITFAPPAGVRTVRAVANGTTYTSDVNVGEPHHIELGHITDLRAGTTVMLTAYEVDVAGNRIADISTEVTYTSDVASDVITPPNTILMTQAGTHTITASKTGLLSGSTSTLVSIGTPTGLQLVGPSSIPAGGTVNYQINVLDMYGNAEALPMALGTISSSNIRDEVIDWSVLVNQAGTRTITAATVGVTPAVTGSTQLTVTPGQLAALSITPADGTFTQGSSQFFVALGVDEFDNVIAPVEGSDVILTSSDPSDIVAGLEVFWGNPGPRELLARFSQNEDIVGFTSATVVAPSMAEAPR